MTTGIYGLVIAAYSAPGTVVEFLGANGTRRCKWLLADIAREARRCSSAEVRAEWAQLETDARRYLADRAYRSQLAARDPDYAGPDAHEIWVSRLGI
jgi:hypothetical protein